MFSPRSIRRIAEGLLEAADVALRPVEVTHPHRRPARVERTRRSGAVTPAEQLCACPLPRRSDRAHASATR